ncbi:4-hydroxy-tetrahydrodipicolinate reductase [Lactobacillus mellis]|uniref:4-hydroxy-tetrahydrodipicolinate reductase n=1 Tax=Bombilactobacillus mellis TaxID=1218508 RepID=UPI0015803CE5|nr:4-hydroxy-tetrahydrodipicolinate reductase [Bombilactobacillus mellis]MCT6841102.1 4-hydroxy-tetrahydrodipicolinate reductase [Bombilactobacillus mellis]MCT6873309.1 4-hydroxy-tetrahydrodipicolinate reductase [Bombilactobacillus mellis]NUG38465.1 4-hydroxy-tetrahydrodipicolinate reductase [Bombilactobacillus mellis]
MKKVLIAGATGSMGRKAVQLIEKQSDYQLVAILAPNATADTQLPAAVSRFDNLADINLAADVWIDFTTPQAVFANVKFALEHQMRPIVGTSGLSAEQVQQLQAIAQQQQLGGIIAPNFGLSAVLLMKFAQEAAHYFPDAEVIEMHHADKLDAPSATAITTARLIAANRKKTPAKTNMATEARGADYDGIAVHSVRLPGYVAHEQVLFGGPGEALTIRQDSFDRSSFMQGVQVALEKVMDLQELVFGLEKIL